MRVELAAAEADYLAAADWWKGSWTCIHVLNSESSSPIKQQAASHFSNLHVGLSRTTKTWTRKLNYHGHCSRVQQDSHMILTFGKAFLRTKGTSS